MEYILIIQNTDPRWWILPVPFLLIIDVIMTSLILLNIIYVLANFLILSDTLLFKYFFLYVFFEGNLVSVDNFHNFTP